MRAYMRIGFQERQQGLEFGELYLNAMKCNVVSFTRTKSPCHYNYVISNTKIGRLTKIKDLGLIFNHVVLCYMSMKRQRHMVLDFARSFTNNKAFFAYVRIRIEYCFNI